MFRQILMIILIPMFSMAQHFSELYNHTARKGVLDSAQKTFLITGYSTSHKPTDGSWSIIFRNMLNQHAGNDTTYYVFKHTVGGTPIAKWTNICGTGEHVSDALSNYVNPGTLIPAGVPKATIMLAQQSLQWAFNNCADRYKAITGPEDESNIHLGTQAINYYMNLFFSGGILESYMATHIYKTGNYPLNLDGEKYALTRALDSLQNFYPGPELFEITKSLFPDGFAADQVHPGPEVANAMALYWYLVVAGEDAKMEIMQPVADAAGIQIPQSDIPELDHLVAYWPFDEEKGLAFNDRSLNALNGELNGSPLWVEGKKNGAIFLDGTDDYGRVFGKDGKATPGEIDILHKGTIAFWFKYENIYNNNGTIIPQSLPMLYYGQADDKTGQNGLEIYIGHNDLMARQRVYITVHKGGVVLLCFDNGFDLDAGTWYHFAVAIDTLDHRGYINGVEYSRHYNAGANSKSHAYFDIVEEVYRDLFTFGYGRFSSKGFWHFHGAMDEIYLYDKALAETEIQALYNAAVTSVAQDVNNAEIPEDFNLFQNYPNPFNPTTTIRYIVPISGYIELVVYNGVGQKVRTIVNEYQANGEYSVIWDGKDHLGTQLSSGVFYYRLNLDKDFSQTKKALLIK